MLKVAAPHVVVHHDIVQFPEPGRSARTLHDLNVIGTLQLLAACGDLPGLRALVVRGSARDLRLGADAPAFFTEDLAARRVAAHALPARRRRARAAGRGLRAPPSRGRVHRPAAAAGHRRRRSTRRSCGCSARRSSRRSWASTRACSCCSTRTRSAPSPPRCAAGARARSTSRATARSRWRARCAAWASARCRSPRRSTGRRSRRWRARACVPPLNEDVIRYLRNGRGVDTTRMRRDLASSRPTRRPRRSTRSPPRSAAERRRGGRVIGLGWCATCGARRRRRPAPARRLRGGRVGLRPVVRRGAPSRCCRSCTTAGGASPRRAPSTCPRPAARCWWPTTPASCRGTRR